jgi:hypothetical protein
MLKLIKTFYQLPTRRKTLFLIGLALSGYTFVLMRFFQRYAHFKKPNAASDTDDATLVRDIRWAIAVVNKHVPWENVCRHQAYQAMLLCGWYGIDYQIFVGFKKNPDTAQIEGHAWSMAGGQMLTGFCNPEEYTLQQVFTSPPASPRKNSLRQTPSQ